MALPQGGFQMGGAGLPGDGGAYTYRSGLILPQYFAGTFLIDTGYDDPVAWTTGVQAAEIYGARVYVAAATSNPVVGSGVSEGIWMIAASPVWSANELQDSGGIIQQRVYIRCECYLKSPPSTANTAYAVLEWVNWSMYRL